MGRDISSFGEKLLEGNTDSELWEDTCNQLQEVLDKVAEGAPMPYYWHADSVNFGWRQLNGNMNFSTNDAGEFLYKILPQNTDCYFIIYVDYEEKIIRIQNYHHDNQTGNEWYVIRPQKEDEGE